MENKKIALYVRSAINEESSMDTHTCEYQIDKLHDFCNGQGYEVDPVHIYIDKGVSGVLDIEKRDSLKKLFDSVKQKKIDTVIVYRLDRLFRNSRKLLETLQNLDQMGIKFISATEPIDTDKPSGKMVLNLLGSSQKWKKTLIIKELKNMSKENLYRKKVAIYIRVSTDEQAESGYGLEVQEERLMKYVQSQDYLLQEVYKDDGYSGTLAVEKRPAMQKMFEDAKDHKFEMVIVYRLDRFFRKTKGLINAVEDLDEMKVDFKSATEPFDTATPSGKFVLQMLGAIAELEKETIRERMSGGREQAAKRGNWVTGVPPYGYKVNKEKKLELVPEEEKVVKMFYEWLVYEKCSLGEITRRANELKLPAPKHNTIKKRKTFDYWWKRSINRILVNEVYTGDFYYKKHKRPFKYLESQTNPDNHRPKEEWIPLKVPAIVSHEMFQKSIEQLKKNRDDSKRNIKRPYLFTKLLHCGHTGNKLQSGYQTPKVHKNSDELGKYYHTYVRESK